MSAVVSMTGWLRWMGWLRLHSFTLRSRSSAQTKTCHKSVTYKCAKKASLYSVREWRREREREYVEERTMLFFRRETPPSRAILTRSSSFHIIRNVNSFSIVFHHKYLNLEMQGFRLMNKNGSVYTFRLFNALFLARSLFCFSSALPFWKHAGERNVVNTVNSISIRFGRLMKVANSRTLLN